MKKWLALLALLVSTTALAQPVQTQTNTLPTCAKVTGVCPVANYICLHENGDDKTYRCKNGVWTVWAGPPPFPTTNCLDAAVFACNATTNVDRFCVDTDDDATYYCDGVATAAVGGGAGGTTLQSLADVILGVGAGTGTSLGNAQIIIYDDDNGGAGTDDDQWKNKALSGDCTIGNTGVIECTQADALESDPADCSGNNFALGIVASGAATCAQPAFSNLSGTVADTQIADGAVDGGTGGEIADDSITAADIAASGVATSEILDETILVGDLDREDVDALTAGECVKIGTNTTLFTMGACSTAANSVIVEEDNVSEGTAARLDFGAGFLVPAVGTLEADEAEISIEVTEETLANDNVWVGITSLATPAALADSDAAGYALGYDITNDVFSAQNIGVTRTGATVSLATTGNEVVLGSATSLGSKLSIDGDDAAQIQVLLQGTAAQSADMLVVENSTGTDVLQAAVDGIVDLQGIRDIDGPGTAFNIPASGAATFVSVETDPAAAPAVSFKDSDMGGTEDVNAKIGADCARGTTAGNDEDCELSLQVQSAGTLLEMVRIESPSAGVHQVRFGAPSTNYVSVDEAGVMSFTGATADIDLPAAAVDAITEIAAGIKSYASDTKVATTSVTAPASPQCVQMDANGSLTLTGAGCSASGGDAVFQNASGATTNPAADVNFLDNIYVDWTLTTGPTPDDMTAKFIYNAASGDHALLGANECAFAANGLVCQGSTASDNVEIYLQFPNPATTDKTLTFPNVTGTLVSTGDTGTVDATMMAANSVAASEIATDAVEAAEIKDGEVGVAEIATGGVGAAEIGDDVIDFADISDTPSLDAATTINVDGTADGTNLALHVTATDTDAKMTFGDGGTSNYVQVTLPAGAMTAVGTATIVATTGDSATSFFSAGTIEDARLPASMADKTITGGLVIPAVADAAGEIGIDATTGQLQYHSTSVRALPYIQTFSAVLESPADADSFLLMKAPYGMTILGIDCVVDPAGTGESIAVTVDECDSAGDTCAGVDGATTIPCGNAGAADDGTLSNPSIDSGDWIRLDMAGAPTGTITALTVTVRYAVVAD